MKTFSTEHLPMIASIWSITAVQRCSVKKVFLALSQNSQENSCEFCEISKNIFSYRTPAVAASVNT